MNWEDELKKEVIEVEYNGYIIKVMPLSVVAPLIESLLKQARIEAVKQYIESRTEQNEIKELEK